MMAMGSLSDADDDFNPEINTTPLVDVMLVLLIIFIITIPVINHSVKIDLPRATNQPNLSKPENINLSIDAQGKVYWNNEILDAGQLNARIAVAAKKAHAGILICNTGIGMSITANKVAGVRAALVSDPHTAQMSREHNDANVLVMGAAAVDKTRARDIVKAWFAAQFQGGRHARRVGKIEDLEKGE